MKRLIVLLVLLPALVAATSATAGNRIATPRIHKPHKPHRSHIWIPSRDWGARGGDGISVGDLGTPIDNGQIGEWINGIFTVPTPEPVGGTDVGGDDGTGDTVIHPGVTGIPAPDDPYGPAWEPDPDAPDVEPITPDELGSQPASLPDPVKAPVADPDPAAVADPAVAATVTDPAASAPSSPVSGVTSCPVGIGSTPVRQTVAADGTLVQMEGAFECVTGTARVRFEVYADNNGTPGALIAASSVLTIPNLTGTLYLAAPPMVDGLRMTIHDDDYWVAAVTVSGTFSTDLVRMVVTT